MQLLITVFIFFSSVWLALFLSKQITRPVEALAEAMDEIAAGKYDHRVAAIATGEMGDLVRSFNHMAADLEASRQLAESSSAQLTAANQAIEERRRELETIVETIPSGVVTLDGSGIVLQSNRAFAALMGLAGRCFPGGEKIETLLPAECAEDLAGLIRRGQRMGAASTEIEFHARGRTIHLAITSARLELAHGQTGTVLVVEDTTELLRAQRQLAWKEVAQRVAHEIKNPLTPIALSRRAHRQASRPRPARLAEHHPQVQRGDSGLRRHAAHAGGPVLGAGAVSRAAAARLRHESGRRKKRWRCSPAALKASRCSAIWSQACPRCWPIPRPLRRALANLIDNAAEAMQGSLLRVLGDSQRRSAKTARRSRSPSPTPATD